VEDGERAGLSHSSAGSLAELPAEQPYPGVSRRTIDGAGASVVFYAMEANARFPLHRHPQEQITVVREGSLLMRIGGDDHELRAEDFKVVPGGVEHGITAGADGATLLVVLTPRREAGEQVELLSET
jgi:quercetin dioxygenase-like cupin family protein